MIVPDLANETNETAFKNYKKNKPIKIRPGGIQVMLRRDSKKNFQICKNRFQEKLTTKIKALKAAKKLWKGS